MVCVWECLRSEKFVVVFDVSLSFPCFFTQRKEKDNGREVETREIGRDGGVV